MRWEFSAKIFLHGLSLAGQQSSIRYLGSGRSKSRRSHSGLENGSSKMTSNPEKKMGDKILGQNIWYFFEIHYNMNYLYTYTKNIFLSFDISIVFPFMEQIWFFDDWIFWENHIPVPYPVHVAHKSTKPNINSIMISGGNGRETLTS